MPRRQRGCLVEKKQLGPAAPAHHLAPPTFELAHASDPGSAGPAPRQRLGRGIMNNAAIAGEHSTMRRGDDLARWRDAVLQGHGLFYSREVRRVGKALACPPS